jgi:hypothetical protein
MPKKRVTIRCYSTATGSNLLRECEGKVTGASIDSCHPHWRKNMCDPDRRCHCYFPQGNIFKRKKLASLLKKSEVALSGHDLHHKAIEFEHSAYKRCRVVTITAEG